MDRNDQTESYELRKLQHVSDIGWFTILLIPISTVLFIADIGTDWYMAGKYVHQVFFPERNYMDDLRDKFLNQTYVKKADLFFSDFCKDAFDEKMMSERAFFLDRYNHPENYFDENIFEILNQSRSGEGHLLYEFIHRIFTNKDKNIRCNTFLFDPLQNRETEIVALYSPAQIMLAYTYYCQTLLNNTEKWDELKPLLDDGNCSSILDSIHSVPFLCEAIKDVHKELYIEYYENICNKAYFSNERYDSFLSEWIYSNIQHNSFSAQEIYKKKVDDAKSKQLNSYIDIYLILLDFSHDNETIKFLEKEDPYSILYAYLEKYWPVFYGIAVAVALLIAAITNLRLKLWKNFQCCPINWLWLPLFKMFNLQLPCLQMENWTTAWRYLGYRIWKWPTERYIPNDQERLLLLQQFQERFCKITVITNAEARTEALPQFIFQLLIVTHFTIVSGWSQRFSLMTSVSSFLLSIYSSRKAQNILNGQRESLLGYALYALGRSVPIVCRFCFILIAFQENFLYFKRSYFYWMSLVIVLSQYILAVWWMRHTRSYNDGIYMAGFVWLIEPLATVHDHSVTLCRAVVWSLIYLLVDLSYCVLWVIAQEYPTYVSEYKILILTTVPSLDIAGRAVFCLYCRYRHKFIIEFEEEPPEIVCREIVEYETTV